MQISVKKLNFRYPNAEKPALSNIDLEISEGSFTTLCGVSGCGKSTLLRMLKPCLAPHGELSGEIFFEGTPLSMLSENAAARDIGFVMQDPEAQICTDRVWHELAFSLESIGEPPERMRRRVAECAAFFGLERLFESGTASLSGGEKQLLALASAAALRPKLLLLDEPTSQLDPIAARNFFDCAARLNRDFGMTVLIAEHRLEELLPVSDRVIVMENGGILAECAPKELAEALPRDHEMTAALPAAMRIFALSGARGKSPVSVREGRANTAVREFLKNNPPSVCGEFSPCGKPVLSVKELCVSYGKRLPDALSSVSLSIFSGEIYALLGGNGSGKSTLLKAIFGMVKPLGGKLSRCAALAYLPQNPCEILGANSVAEEFTARKISNEAARSALEKFGLSELLKRDPLDLSGGERQRLALAVLLSAKPGVLLLDEPTKGMDAAAKNEFSKLLVQISSEGTAALLVTHDAEFAAGCADMCGLLFNGEIVSEGAPSFFFADNYFYTTPLCRLAKGIMEGYI